ncbi:PaaI family thioesterase [Novosphingobium sp. Fuku2-ISO-50]|jgi:uncharacterized protein (TIGR00369 family)|uniref:PaaI family thioesterase n=1 Tax=Novosphingobium sp. Fuku2-ISO-50 TaxID=1739114 RepID=UPI00076CEDE6|nr:PaaI family thioesterase [Novosphingobium sp. Fuku2-ISO-50]KUR80422.1 phenylacetic acid degradation protein [Novosphingobium sp. Fuku2-ISO-50]
MMKSTELPPYAQAMGMEFAGTDNGSPLIAMDFAERAMGRPGFLHGGAIGGLLEMAGFTALEAELERQGADVRIKPINISVEYLRGGLPERIYARGEVVRAGRRVANVRIDAWQSDRERPVASCWMNFQLSPKKT